MEEIIVFVGLQDAPPPCSVAAITSELQASLEPGERLTVDVDTTDLTLAPGEVEFARGVLGEMRIAVISYLGTASAATALSRIYASVPALARPDSDAILPISDIVTLMQRSGGAHFHTWADPTKRAVATARAEGRGAVMQPTTSRVFLKVLAYFGLDIVWDRAMKNAEERRRGGHER